MENSNIVWPWDWVGNDDDPLDILSQELHIAGAATKHLSLRKNGEKYNHRIILRHGDDLLHIIFVYRNTASRKAEYKKIRVILKSEGEDFGFDIQEDWNGQKITHGVVANTATEFSHVSRIADILDVVALDSGSLREQMV